MKVCIIGDGLVSLALKMLIQKELSVDILSNLKKINMIRLEL